jgi:chemotaxis signal transduction protein
VDVIVFELESRRFAVSLRAMLEVIPIGPVTPIPTTPSVLLGAMNVSGQVFAVVHLQQMLMRDDEPAAPPPLSGEPGLLVQSGGCQAVLYVGKIKEVMRIRSAQVISSGGREMPVSAVLATDIGVLHLIDLDLVLHRLTAQLAEKTSGMRIWGS